LQNYGRGASLSEGRSGSLAAGRGAGVLYRSTWTQREPRRLSFRFEVLVEGKWIVTAADDCRW